MEPHKPFDELVKSPLDPWWVKRGAPDANSMMAAVRVQMLLAAGDHSSAADYIIDQYGETQEQAEQIVKNCRCSTNLDNE